MRLCCFPPSSGNFKTSKVLPSVESVNEKGEKSHSVHCMYRFMVMHFRLFSINFIQLMQIVSTHNRQQKNKQLTKYSSISKSLTAQPEMGDFQSSCYVFFFKSSPTILNSSSVSNLGCISLLSNKGGGRGLGLSKLRLYFGQFEQVAIVSVLLIGNYCFVRVSLISFS